MERENQLYKVVFWPSQQCYDIQAHTFVVNTQKQFLEKKEMKDVYNGHYKKLGKNLEESNILKENP